jgi:hypothetical protein
LSINPSSLAGGSLPHPQLAAEPWASPWDRPESF